MTTDLVDRCIATHVDDEIDVECRSVRHVQEPSQRDRAGEYADITIEVTGATGEPPSSTRGIRRARRTPYLVWQCLKSMCSSEERGADRRD